MKRMTKLFVALAAVLCIQVPLNAYKFTITNQTSGNITVSVNMSGVQQTHSIDINQSTVFNFNKKFVVKGPNNTMSNLWMGNQCFSYMTAMPAPLPGTPPTRPKTVELINPIMECSDNSLTIYQNEQGEFSAQHTQF